MTLKGNTDSYTFDPSDKSAVLRAKGKFGSAFIGRRNSDGAKVVVKMLNPALKNDPKAVHRFVREAHVDRAINGLLQVYDVIEQDGDHYLVREFMEGSDLKKMCSGVKLPLDDLVSAMTIVCGILHSLHLKGIVHRDIRPANILVGDEDTSERPGWNSRDIKLIDLGLARFPGDDRNEKTPFALIYSPPEQVMNCEAAVNASSDLYSLGVTLYECITGKVPFHHSNPEMMMQLMINMPLEKDRSIPEPLWKIISKATSKYKFPLPPNKYKKDELLKLMLKGQEKRYSTASNMATDLTLALKELGPEKKDGFLKRLFKR